MPLWDEYRRIKQKGSGYSDGDVRVLLNFIHQLLMSWNGTSEELRAALEQLEIANGRVRFYQNINQLKEV